MPISYKTRVDRELLFEFYLTFSRFEYALKAAGLFRRPNPQRNLQPTEAKPNWDGFAVSLRDTFHSNKTHALKQACEYILGSPPMKQVIINDGVAWETPMRPTSESEVEFLLRMVRCVRNNLVHGGKYNVEAHEDTQRTEILLRSSLAILVECLALATHVRQAFDEAII